MSSFAVFRRPALPSDRLAALTQSRDGLDRELARLYELSSYYPAYIRRLPAPIDGRRYFVIPAYGRPETVPAAHCMAAAQRSVLLQQQRRRAIEPVDCIVATGGQPISSADTCEPFAAIAEASRVFHADSLTRQPTVELVPDGVATVRISYRESPPTTVRVRQNTFSFTSPRPTRRVAAALGRLVPMLITANLSLARERRRSLRWNRLVHDTAPTRIEWFDSAGRTLRVIDAPPAGSSSATSIGSLQTPIEG